MVKKRNFSDSIVIISDVNVMVHYLNVFFGVLDFLMLKTLVEKNLASGKLGSESF